MVFSVVERPLVLTPDQVRRLADRHFGIGCDQVLLVGPSPRPGVDFSYRIFNADGGEVEQCGNGARCFVRYVRDHGLTDKDEIAVETAAGVIRPRVEADGGVTVDMGAPVFEPAAVPFDAPGRQPYYHLEVDGRTLEVSVLSMGNPHAVQLVDDVDHAPVASLGPLIERHPRFPRRVNAGFMQIVDASRIRLRVYERGAGETLACGTGACAAVVAGRQRGLLNAKVKVELPGGALTVRWEGEGRPVWMTGPAETVFEGTVDIS